MQKLCGLLFKSKRRDHCGVPILQQESTGPKDVGPLPNISEQRMVPDLEPIIVTEERVVDLLKTLQPNKADARGPDKIPFRLLKEYGTFLSQL